MADVKMKALASFHCAAHEGDVAKGDTFETTKKRAALLSGRGLAQPVAPEATKSDLYEQAQALEIEGRSSMTRDELAAAIAEQGEAAESRQTESRQTESRQTESRQTESRREERDA